VRKHVSYLPFVLKSGKTVLMAFLTNSGLFWSVSRRGTWLLWVLR